MDGLHVAISDQDAGSPQGSSPVPPTDGDILPYGESTCMGRGTAELLTSWASFFGVEKLTSETSLHFIYL